MRLGRTVESPSVAINPLPEPETPKPELEYGEIRALHDQHRERQAKLDVEWQAYHKWARGAAHLREAMERRQALSKRQTALNAEREALPPLPVAVVTGINPKRLERRMWAEAKAARFKYAVNDD